MSFFKRLPKHIPKVTPDEEKEQLRREQEELQKRLRTLKAVRQLGGMKDADH